MEKQMIKLDSGHEVHRNMTWEVVLIAGKGGCVWDFKTAELRTFLIIEEEAAEIW